MRFTVQGFSSPDVVVYAITSEAPVIEGKRLKDTAGEVGSATWFRSLDKGASLLALGMGAKEKLGLEAVRAAAGVAARELIKEQAAFVEVDLEAVRQLPAFAEEGGGLVSAFVEGWMLGAYRFDKYKSKKARAVSADVFIRGMGSGLAEAIRRGEIRASGTALARDLGNEPANELYPLSLARIVIERFAMLPVQVGIYRGDGLEEEGLHGLKAVGKGSSREPALIELRYCSDPALPLTALIGKGITFDTGGINVKTAADFSNMRIDMGGAAAVIGAVDILARSGARANVIAMIAAAENGIDGQAMLPGDVIRFANGTTVQVGNTDAEGRLVLADALLRASRLGATRIVDIATLTASCVSALGTSLAGVLGTGGLPERLMKLGLACGDRVWELPLEDSYDEWLKSSYADVSNVPRVPYGGAITAALFLRRFVDKRAAWAHIDMAGTNEALATRGYTPEGATGFGARLLADFAESPCMTPEQAK